MSRYLNVALLLFVAGCTPGHYLSRKGESVNLYLNTSEADEVVFVSSIDTYIKHEAKKEALGVWSIEMPSSKEFRYFYIVDGQMLVPDCRHKELDDFGKYNCIYLP